MLLSEAKYALRCGLEKGALMEEMELEGVCVKPEWKRKNCVEVEAMIEAIQAMKQMRFR